MFSIDNKSRDPIYTQIEKGIIKYINLGIYQADDPLPSVRSLACDLGINPNTVAKAYKNLEAAGVVYTQAGKGIFVKSGNNFDEIHKLIKADLKEKLTDIKNAGFDKTELLEMIDEIWREKND